MRIKHTTITILLNLVLSVLCFVVGFSFATHAHAQTFGFIVPPAPPAGVTGTSSPHPHSNIFRIRRDNTIDHKTINPSYYEHTGILGAASALLVVIILIWVTYQNYLYDKKRKSKDSYLE